MANYNNRKDLGFLGEDFQYKLVKELTDDKELFKDLNSVIDQNMFTDPNLKTYVGVMKEYYDKYDNVPSYDVIQINLFEKAHNDIEREYYAATVDKVKHTPTDGSEYIRQTATRFFKQQNIIKTANEILRIAGNGDTTHYDRCVELLNKALNAGTHDDFGVTVFDNLEETLSDDYRTPIPTGIKGIDDTLEGGLGKGELGVIVGSSSFGKVQPYDAKIATPDGFVEMRDIHVGSFVIGDDGKPHKVIGVFPHENWDFYKVTFSDGVSTECGKEHLWAVNDRYSNDNSYKVMSLEDIMEKGIYLDNGKPKFSIPMTKPVEFNNKYVDINPYTVGWFIGSNVFDFIHSDDTMIPSDYLYNSLDNRIALLNGLMDANGICHKNGQPAYITKSAKLANDVKTLVLSLGGFARINKKKNTYFSIENNKVVDNGFIYEVIITMSDTSIPVFAWTYKQKKVSYKSSIKGKRFIDKIEYSRKYDGQCILIDSESHLYLTDDFIVTHNTTITTAMAGYASTFKCKQNNFEGFKVLQIVFEDRYKQIQRKQIGRLTGIEAKDLSKPDYINHVKEQLDKFPDKEMMKNNLRIIRLPSGEKTAWDIERLIKRFINNGFRPDLVIVDYFECLEHRPDPSLSEWEQEGKTMRKFESMAGDMNIAFWIPVQGTKDSVGAEIVTMDKAGGSFKKIQIAHIVMSIARSNEDIAENKATIAILKNRAGQAGKVFNGVDFNNGTCRISTDNCDDGIDSMFAFDKKRQDDRDKLAADIFKKYKAKEKTINNG